MSSAQTETALDKVYDILRPGADRQACRRTRAAALDISQDRFAVLQSVLLQHAKPGTSDRLKAPHAQFTTADDADADGRVTITLSHEKKK